MKKKSKKPQLTIFNPQPFEVLVTIQPKGTNVIESKKLPANNGKWIVNTPGAEGTWISFNSVSNNKNLAGTLLSQGATFAELMLNAEILIIKKVDPHSKLQLANNTIHPVIVQYELQHEVAISTNILKPYPQKGRAIIAEQQPVPGADLWIKFTTANGSYLASYLANNTIELVGVNGKANYLVAAY